MNSEIKILVTGDFVPGGIFSDQLQYNPIQNIQSLLDDSSLIWTNLEVSFSWGENTIIKRSSVVPGNIELFNKITKNNNWLFSLANNHSYDFGKKSLTKTLEFFRIEKVNYLGAGIDYITARRPFIFVHNNIRIGFLNYTSDQKWVGDHLKEEAAKYISILNEKTYQEVESLRDEVDSLFVGCHFGKEFIKYPLLNDKKIARRIIDSGADAVFGHHPHILQGFEYYNGKPIYYSLGNFLFPNFNVPQKLRWSKNERIGAVVQISISKSRKCTFSIIPIFLNESNDSINKQSKRIEQKFLQKINKISKPISRFEEKQYTNLVEREIRYSALKHIIRGFFRNIFRPKLKHLVMVSRLSKQVLFGLKDD